MEMSDTPIKFSFVDIQIISKKLESPLIFNEIKGDFSFEIQVEIRIKPELSLVIPYVSVKVKDINNSEPLATFIIACLFHVIDFNHVVKLKENGVYHVPQELEKTIKPVSISTIRGIIYSELRGTYLSKAIMPVIYM